MRYNRGSAQSVVVSSCTGFVQAFIVSLITYEKRLGYGSRLLYKSTRARVECGYPGLRSIWEKYYEEAHAVIYVVDAACPSRFEDSKSALEKVLRHEDLQGAPLLILANKQDLADAVPAEELARYLDLKKLDERKRYLSSCFPAYDGE
ncbi:hypothetical protein HAX54_048504 [Datura stramonium]|uniref:Uncharacterized protein n=1 Tax=Datura stramonium TaxID=4076 RepID=A0ABS8SUA8_DATST|nr:hypothetical protein [Datura stramonium]